MISSHLLQSSADWLSVSGSVLLFVVIALAGFGTGTLFAISLVAYLRRQRRRYLLIAAAVGALCVRSAIGIGTMVGVVPMVLHHVLSHGLDFFIAVLILYAVYENTFDHDRRAPE